MPALCGPEEWLLWRIDRAIGRIITDRWLHDCYTRKEVADALRVYADEVEHG